MTATVLDARAAAQATYGNSHEKEAAGLRLVFDALESDGSLVCHKSFEGAKADFCVYKPGSLALGIQLKTTAVDYIYTRTNNGYFHFNHTSGYAGLLLILVALHTDPLRVWLANGVEVLCTTVHIPVIAQTCKEASLQ
jgi:hypothetical protein